MFKTEFENLRRTCPLIHNITNYVTVNDCGTGRTASAWRASS